MADISPIITTLGVFPQVIDAAEKYKTAEPDLESRGIARGIANENAQFEQTTQRLQYPTQLSSSHDYNFVVSQLEANFGAKSTAQILDDLNTLTAQLHSLKAELVNTGRGKKWKGHVNHNKTLLPSPILKDKVHDHLLRVNSP
ncbi:hypothetical protein CkaCkLH20_00539 [Colletotrichum karsti]|uniref:Uncharacterized protein n=1 Tax=Colletotrichum karsti TaxID=1095194 RepID=A0A9P6IFG0_9PEZI|nr:uncharacterized protein CkaCkLH20_00539 [Colletotrichum karsti]KAF9882503.1 hypothetical protein CkaCkLH20_00539 [Colletotrichum karsti]